jgi:hypothetical protein
LSCAAHLLTLTRGGAVRTAKITIGHGGTVMGYNYGDYKDYKNNEYKKYDYEYKKEDYEYKDYDKKQYEYGKDKKRRYCN